VVLLGPEVVDRAAEQTELDAQLDQQREVAVPDRLEGGDRRAHALQAAVLAGEEEGGAVGVGEEPRPLHDLLAVLGRRRRARGALELRAREHGAHVLSHDRVLAVEKSPQGGRVDGQGCR